MTKRQLNETELKFAKSNLAILEDSLEYLEKCSIPKKTLAIETAELELKQQKKKMKKELREFEEQAEQQRKTIVILKDQIENGVEEKEVKGGK